MKTYQFAEILILLRQLKETIAKLETYLLTEIQIEGDQE